MGKKLYDFAGWVTKNDILCADGVTIKHGAFQGNNGTKVPLVWNHNYSDPKNVLGHLILHNKDEGVYGYGHFNDTDEAQHAQSLLEHGDISSMSIGARNIKRSGSDVVHGLIYEVSLVLASANPGALVESVMTHSDDGDDKATIYTGLGVHSSATLLHNEEGEDTSMDNEVEETTNDNEIIGDVMGTLNEKQMDAVEALIASVLEDQDDSDTEEDNDKGDGTMKHNVFNQANTTEGETLNHSAILQDAANLGSLQDALLKHSITNIELMFPDAHLATNEPVIYRDTNTGAETIVNGTTKSPFARVKNLVADFTDEEARARGYIKGAEKVEQVFELLSRETLPQTIYKKQKLDRDDIVDITDFNVVAFINKEMRFMLVEELARAILVGDGRLVSSADKIKEANIRPIISDDDFYTLKKTYTDASDFTESVIKGMADYKGSGGPTMFIDPVLLADVKLLKGTDGRYLFGDIPSTTAVATRLGLSAIVDTTFMAGKGAIIVNLRDYTVGSTKGGEITTFEDFDIDYNQHKYLIETRLSGALTLPHSALYFSASTEPEE